MIIDSLNLKVLHNNDEVIKGADDPFLMVDSILVEGQCRALVCCVGLHSTRSDKVLAKEDFQNTELGGKLNNLFQKFTYIGVTFAFVVLAGSLGIQFI